MPAGPLDDARLRSVEDCLNAGRFDDAQRRLAALASVQGLGPGVAYLSARLLFHRGRLDAASVAARLRDVLVERPDFAEAKAWLETVERSEAVTEPPPPRLPTPRIPEGPRVLDTVPAREMTLGPLEPPRSELPTEPAPPPDPDSSPALVLHIEPAASQPSPWHALEVALASGQRDAVVAGLDQLASGELDALLARTKPKISDLAGEISSFFARAPITRYFAPFDVTLDSVERLDAVVALLVPPGITTGLYALRVFLSVYLGECVREASGGSWAGTLAEPETLTVKHDGEAYVPWARVSEALGEGRSLRKGAGSPPHPGAEPPEEEVLSVAETPTPWDPKLWPTLAEARELTRALANSALGVWAARCLKTPLDRTPGSLRAFDRYAALLNPRAKDPGTTFGWVRHAAVLSGSYLGELVCLHAGGRFSENDAAPEGPLRFEVVLPDGRAVYPLLFAYERLAGKKPGTFAKFFESCLGR
jgi:hypothetical protein